MAAATCYSSLLRASIDMANNGVTNIVLCNNTVFEVGTPIDSTFDSFAGGIPLIVDKNDITIQCGTTGTSTDSCVLEGGFAQLYLGNPNDRTTTVNNLLVKGLTFTGTMESSDAAVAGTLAGRVVYGTNTGTGIVFEDCIFRDLVTGYVFDISPVGTAMNVEITSSTFQNISHSFDLIYGDALASITLDGVAFDNIDHIEPEDGIEKCEGANEFIGCDYTSSIINVAGTLSLSDVTISDSVYYTAILQTVNLLTITPDPLVNTTNISIFDQGNRTINEEYCLGGYAYGYNTTTGFGFTCTRLTGTVGVLEILRCGRDCTLLDEFSKFLSYLELTGLDDTLVGLGDDVTVFAPTNEAIENAPDGFLEKLIATDQGTLKTILEYHITKEDAVLTSAIEDGYPASETLMGESVVYTPPQAPSNLFKVDQAHITIANWEEGPSPGKIVQVIDAVLVPESVEVFPSISERIEELGLTSFLDVAAAIEWDPGFELGKKYTAFIPTNSAIDDNNEIQNLVSTSGKSDAQKASDRSSLESILNNQIVEGNYDMEFFQAQPCLVLRSLAGRNIKITFNSDTDTVLWNDKITNGTQVDIVAHDGYVHTIQGVLSLDDNLECSSSTVHFVSLPLVVALSALGSIYTLLA